MKLLLATNNLNKVKEFNQLLPDCNFSPLPINVPETGRTFRANAILKAKTWGHVFHQLVLADDSGLCIDYLHGEPGINSHRFASRGFSAARHQILGLLKNIPWFQRTAHFVCCLALYDPINNKLKTFTAQVKGYISFKEVGNNGFGYDSIFYYPPLKKTFAQMSLTEKNCFSHRARAVAKLQQHLKELALIR